MKADISSLSDWVAETGTFWNPRVIWQQSTWHLWHRHPAMMAMMHKPGGRSKSTLTGLQPCHVLSLKLRVVILLVITYEKSYLWLKMMIQNNQIPYIIFGSSRSFGDTRKAVDLVAKNKPNKIIDLNELSISYYDYGHANKNDDFISLIKNMLNHQKWVFATPVYWYTMSAIMKTFFDRITDLLTIEKDLGRQLRGKDAYVISCDGGERTKSFEEIFQKTFDYLGMNYKGTLFYYSGIDTELSAQNQDNISKFCELLYS